MPFSSRVLSWLVQEQGSVRGKSEWLASKDSVYVYRMIKPPPSQTAQESAVMQHLNFQCSGVGPLQQDNIAAEMWQ